ncbi:hypothetical protein CRUP_019121 [Coryphaenoides rupestris]|nr:hypothetical protein CRUP_019121 [Coryphaenoides rupestris]
MLRSVKRRSHTEADRELRQNKLTLFIQQFEKEAQGRIAEMEAKLDNLLTTVDKYFQVALMKTPPSLRKTLIAELINDSQAPEEGIE